MIIEYLKYLRICIRGWDWKDWIVAPIVIPCATIGILIWILRNRRKFPAIAIAEAYLKYLAERKL